LKEVTFINQDSGYLMIDIINQFDKEGYKCNLIAGRLVERNTPLNESVFFDKIIRYSRNSIIARLVTWLIGSIQIIFKIWFRYKRSHLFIVSNPPTAPLLPLICKNSYSLLFYDVYIEKPMELPVLKKLSPLNKLWVKAHIKVIRGSRSTFTLTEGMRNVLSRFAGEDNIRVIPVWTDNSFLKPLPKGKNNFIIDHGLENKFIVMYSGNLGASSGIETIVDIAKSVNQSDIFFVIVGDGIRKTFIQNRVREMGLSNCIFLPWQHPSILPYSLAAADLAVVSLSSSASERSIPSKLYNFLSVGVPILGLANSKSDLANFIAGNSVGFYFEHSKIKEISDYITRIANNPDEYERLKFNSQKTSKYYTPENAKLFLNDF
jgi:glycosyltransferase involved in cell wall biosynthesis